MAKRFATPLFQFPIKPGPRRIHLVHDEGYGPVFNLDAEAGIHHTLVWSFQDDKLSRQSDDPIDIGK